MTWWWLVVALAACASAWRLVVVPLRRRQRELDLWAEEVRRIDRSLPGYVIEKVTADVAVWHLKDHPDYHAVATRRDDDDLSVLEVVGVR